MPRRKTKRTQPIRLIPRGRNWEEPQLHGQQPHITKDEINGYRCYAIHKIKAFPIKAKGTDKCSSIPTRKLESGFSNKIAYLNYLEAEHISEQNLIYFLSDRYTIFNRKYQNFSKYHSIYVGLRKDVGDEDNWISYCQNTALNLAGLALSEAQKEKFSV